MKLVLLILVCLSVYSTLFLSQETKIEDTIQPRIDPKVNRSPAIIYPPSKVPMGPNAHLYPR